MSDLVERLYKTADAWDRTGENIDTDLWREAAAEIERLRSLVGKAAVGSSFAEITKDIPRRSTEPDPCQRQCAEGLHPDVRAFFPPKDDPS